MGVRWGRWRSAGGALAIAVLVFGVLVSIGTGLLLSRSQNKANAETMDRLMASAEQSVAGDSSQYVSALQVAAGGLGAPAALTSDIFLSSTAPLRQLNLRGASAVSFVVAATDTQVPAVQRYWREHGANDLTLQPLGTDRTHYFSVMRQQLDDAAPSTLGVDLTAAAQAIDAIVRARRYDQPALSDPYVLLRDRNLPVARQQLAFVLAQPVYAEQDGSFRGLLLMSLRGQDFIGATLANSGTSLRDVSLSVPFGSSVRQVAVLHGQGRHADYHRSVVVPVADKSWWLTADADRSVLRGHELDLHIPVMVVGGLLSLLMAVLLFVLRTTRDRIRDQFLEATEELRRTERHTNEQATLLRAVMDSIGDAVVVVDSAGTLTVRNSAALAMFGPEPDLTAGLYTVDGNSRYPQKDLPLKRVLEGDGPSTAELVLRNKYRPEGAWLNVAAEPLSTGGSRAGAVVVFHDVTERRRADEQLRISEQQLRLLLDSARDHAIFLLTRDGRVASWSANAERLEGYRAAEIVGHEFETFFPAEDVDAGAPAELMRRAVDEGRADLDGWRLRKDGSRFWAHGHLVVARDPDGSVRGFVVVVQDITERREAEQENAAVTDRLEQRVAQRTAALAEQAEQLRQSNAELESFSYSVSHDLRAPLRAVDGFAKMLAMDYDDRLDDTGRRYLARIRAGAQQMGDLIDGLLTFSRLQRQALTWQPVKVDALAHDVWEELVVERGERDLEVRIDPVPAAVGDPRLVRHVLANLVGNAVKYTRGRDVARVEVGHTVTAGGQATYFVRDNGTGFDMRYADKLFKVFQRLHRAEDYEGTGIGLALAQRIVQRHGGRMWADAVPDEGATFYFSLPTGIPEGNHDEAAADAGAAGRGQPRRSGAGPARV